MDFKLAQAAAQATILGSRKAPAADILATTSPQPVPITARSNQHDGQS